MTNGISIAQQGIPIDKAADYQKVLDSRWRFMEIEHTVPETSVAIPSISTTGSSFKQRVRIYPHNLDFVPVFHCDWTHDGAASGGSYNDFGEVFCDEVGIYFERNVFGAGGNSTEAVTLRLKAKIYNLPAFDEYRAMSEVVGGVGRAKSRIGIKILDGSESNVKIDDKSSVGFSVDTTKKILAVHKVTTKVMNSWLFDMVGGTSINTTNDEITYTVETNISAGDNTGTGWVKTGIPVTISPADFVTYPLPLSDSTYYLIRVSDTVLKLATSQANAEAGTAIDITTSGSLPLFIRRAYVTGDDRISHETGYPPSYLFCEYVDRVNEVPAVLPLFHIATTPLVESDNNYLYFRGVQGVYSEKIVCIILKDPVEIAS